MRHLYATENLPHRLEKGVKESANTQTEELPKALQLDNIGSQARHDTPYVIKTEASEVDSAHYGSWYTADGCYNPITPVLGGHKCTEAGPPHAIDTVRTVWLSEHILKENLFGRMTRENNLFLWQLSMDATS